MKKFVSVLIPVYRDWDRLQLCLNALANQTHSMSEFEIIVINNDPSNKVPSNVKFTRNSILIDEKKPGSYAARNKGVIHSKGNILAFTDSDCIPDKNWIKNIIKTMRHDIDRVAGHVELTYQSKRLSLSEIYEKSFAFDQEHNSCKGASVTANMITWKKSFEDVGYFNDDLLSGGDYEWSMRAKKKGLKIIYSSEIIVFHPARDNLRAILNKKKRVAGGIAMLEKKSINLISMFRGYLPPLRVLIYLKSKKTLSLYEILVSFFLHWIFSIYVSNLKILYKIGYNKYERV